MAKLIQDAHLDKHAASIQSIAAVHPPFLQGLAAELAALSTLAAELAALSTVAHPAYVINENPGISSLIAASTPNHNLSAMMAHVAAMQEVVEAQIRHLEAVRTRAFNAAIEAAVGAQAFLTRDPGPLHYAAIEAGLECAGEDTLTRRALADGPTRARFAAELVMEARRVVEHVFTDDLLTDGPDRETMARTASGVAAERFAAMLDGINADLATEVREVTAERAQGVADGAQLPGILWVLWVDPDAPGDAPRWARTLALALWRARWRGEIEAELTAARELARKLTPAHHIEVMDALRSAMSVHEVEGDQLIGRDGRTLTVLAPASITDALGEHARNPTAAEFRSVDAHRFLLCFLATVHARWVNGEPDFRALLIEGRWPGLAEMIRASDGRGLPDRTVLAKIVPFMGRIRIPGPDGASGNLYAFDPGAPARRNARGWLAITAGTMLHRGAIKARPSWDRDTVPVAGLPPMAGVLTRSNEHGQLATLRFYTVRRLKQSGSDLVTKGGGLLPGPDMAADMAAVGLHAPLVRAERIFDAWTRDGDDAPAFLVRVGRDRYHLNPDAHPGARAYLDFGAELTRAAEARHAAKKGRK